MPEFTLPNGFKTICHRDATHPLVSLSLFVKMGAGFETDSEAGLSHLTEHMVFKNTAKFPANSLSDRAAFLGAALNAFTEYDSTCYYLTLPAEHLADALDILCELVRYPVFTAKDFRCERRVVIEEMKQYHNEPEDFFIEEIARRYFQTSAFRKPILGAETDLRRHELADLQRFHQRHYRPERCFLVAAGDFDPERMESLTHELFDSWEPGDAAPPDPVAEPYPTTPGFQRIPRKISQPLLAFVIPELGDCSPDCHAHGLALKTLAHGKESRLYDRLFYREQVINSLHIHSYGGITDGVAIILMEPRQNADYDHLAQVFLEELRRIHLEGLPGSEIRKLVNELTLSHRYAYEYVENLAQGLGNEELVGGYHRFYDYPEQLTTITREQVCRVAREYLSPSRVQAFILGSAPFDADSFIASACSAPQPARALPDGPIDEQLDSGLRLFMNPSRGKGVVGLALCLPVSQLDERSDRRGINQMTASLLLHGAGPRNYRTLLETCSANGVIITAGAHLESTILLAKCFPEHLPLAIELLDDILRKPLFPQDHLDNLRNAYRESLERMRDYPEQYAHYLWRRMMFGPGSRLLHRRGTREHLAKISVANLRDWHAAHYRPERATLVALGDFDPARLREMVAARFPASGRPPLPVVNRDPRITPPVKSQRSMRTDSDQSVIHIGGFGSPGTETLDNTAFYVLSHILGGDLYSRMSIALRESLGASYSCGFDFQAIQDVGFFDAQAVVDRKREKKSLDAIRDILRQAATEPVTQLELDTAKNAIRGFRLMEQESVLQQAEMLSMLLSLRYDYDFFLNRENRLQSVRADRILDLAQKYFQPGNLFTYILS
jgi:zinc protease